MRRVASLHAQAWAPLAVLLATAGVSAQSRERPPSDPTSAQITGAPGPRCTMRAGGIVVDAPRSPDVQTPVPIVAFEDRALVAWRSTDGALVLSRLRGDLSRDGDDREIARPAGPFAMAPAPAGAVVAMTERDANGEDVVLLARLSPAGEARNVPREIARVSNVDAVAVTSTGNGFALAWSTHAASGAITAVAFADAHGVPTVAPRTVLDGGTPRLLWLSSTQTLVVTATVVGDDPNMIALAGDGSLVDSSHRSGSAGPVVASPSGTAALSLVLGGESEGVPSALVERWTPGSDPSALALGSRPGAGATIAFAVTERSGMLVAIDDAQGRESLTRVGLDGSSTVLTTRLGRNGSLSVAADGVVWLAAAGPAPTRRIDLLQLSCARAPVVQPGDAVSSADGGSRP